MGITFLLLLAILVLLAYPSFAFSINCCQKLNASKSSSLQKVTAGNASVYPLSCSYTNVKLIALHCPYDTIFPLLSSAVIHCLHHTHSKTHFNSIFALLASISESLIYCILKLADIRSSYQIYLTIIHCINLS